LAEASRLEASYDRCWHEAARAARAFVLPFVTLYDVAIAC
jgi:hypothetical protein